MGPSCSSTATYINIPGRLATEEPKNAHIRASCGADEGVVASGIRHKVTCTCSQSSAIGPRAQPTACGLGRPGLVHAFMFAARTVPHRTIRKNGIFH